MLADGSAVLVAQMATRGGLSMPAFNQVLSEPQINLVAAYVADHIADPVTHTARSADGGQIFRLYCSGCHGATGRGGAMAEGRNAPSIARYPAAEALAAMIYGRGNMPTFADTTLDIRQQTSVALYVQAAIIEPPSPGGHGLGFVGPVSEGAMAALGLAGLILITVWLAWPSRKALP
jgi:ubiquinol-cytochrome c reductase cytochrome c subunit